MSVIEGNDENLNKNSFSICREKAKSKLLNGRKEQRKVFLFDQNHVIFIHVIWSICLILCMQILYKRIHSHRLVFTHKAVKCTRERIKKIRNTVLQHNQTYKIQRYSVHKCQTIQNEYVCFHYRKKGTNFFSTFYMNPQSEMKIKFQWLIPNIHWYCSNFDIIWKKSNRQENSLISFLTSMTIVWMFCDNLSLSR